MNEILDIVNKQDEIIGTDTRENVHKLKLIHREIYVWVFNDAGEVVLQKRSDAKEQYPGLWFYSLGGHVNSGENYLNSAIREANEEVGIKILENELIFLDKALIKNEENNHFETIYAYKYKNKYDTIKIANEELSGLMWINIDNLLKPDEDFKKQIVPYLLNEKSKETLNKIKQLIK
ncbi:MAG: NUDIX domain-containing protein [Patescibacteria group bacterium]|nr:NUDIX domain-containing protein [Patescibacteria group bacterium]